MRMARAQWNLDPQVAGSGLPDVMGGGYFLILALEMTWPIWGVWSLLYLLLVCPILWSRLLRRLGVDGPQDIGPLLVPMLAAVLLSLGVGFAVLIHFGGRLPDSWLQNPTMGRIQTMIAAITVLLAACLWRQSRYLFYAMPLGLGLWKALPLCGGLVLGGLAMVGVGGLLLLRFQRREGNFAGEAPRLRASRSRRFVAFLLDQGLVGLPGWIILALSPFTAVLPFLDAAWARAWSILALAFQMTLAARGLTAGRALTGLALIRQDGEPVSAFRGMGRDLLALVLWVPFLADPLFKTQVRLARPVNSGWVNPGCLAISLVGMLATLLAIPRTPSRATRAWIQRNGLPIGEGGEAGQGLEGLGPLHASCQVVGLGEATHGTLESSRVKVGLIQVLARNPGLSMICIEVPYPNTLAANRFVLDGVGDPRLAVRELGFWTVGTEEVQALLEWVRRYNLEAGPGSRIRFLGVDIQAIGAAWRQVRNFLERQGRDHEAWAAAHDREIRGLGEVLSPGVPAVQLERALGIVSELLAILDANGEVFRSADPTGFREARQCALVMAQDLRSWLGGQGGRGALRDRFMAENLLAFMKEYGPGARAVVWAHNSHVSFAQGSLDGADPMGFHLRARLGDGYRAWGVALNEGTFIGLQGGHLREIRLNAARPGSLEHGLAQCERNAFALDLRSAPGRQIPAWFQRPLAFRCIGALVPTFQALQYRAVVPARQFDGVLFLGHTNASRPLDLLPPCQDLP